MAGEARLLNLVQRLTGLLPYELRQLRRSIWALGGDSPHLRDDLLSEASLRAWEEHVRGRKAPLWSLISAMSAAKHKESR